MKTAIINSSSCEKHNTGDGHPEQPKRVITIKEKLKKRKDLIWDKPDNVPDDILSMTHSKDYIYNLKNSFPQKGLKFLDGDTVVSPESKKAVFDAAGSDVWATGSVIESRGSSEVTFDTSAANETKLTFTPANAATNLFTTGSMIAFICYEDGTYHIASKMGGAADATTGAFVFAS